MHRRRLGVHRSGSLIVGSALEPLLVAIAAEGLTDARPASRERLDDTTFDALVDACADERITGHLERALESGTLPASLEQRDRALERHEEVLAGDVVLERLLVDTSAALRTARIPHRALKGPVVARVAYPDVSLRSFGDVDLLIAGSRFDDAVALLEQRGGHARYREPRRSFTARYGKGVCVETATGLEIDLHRVFVAGPFGLAIDTDDLFAELDEIEIGGTRVPAPPAPLCFLHACYHVALTNPRLSAVRDVAQFAARDDLDVDRSLALAGRWRGRAVVQRALQLTRARLPARFSAEVYAWADRYEPDRFERTALAPYTSSTRSYAAQMATGIWAVRGIRPRAQYAFALLFPDDQYLREREGSYAKRWRRAFELHRSARRGR